MELRSSKVFRKLDAKWKIGGLELPDLLFVLILSAVMNLFFGRTILALPLVIVTPLAVAALLYFGKKNKPENYLIHLARYHLSPGFYSAGENSHYIRGKIYEKE